MKLRWNVPDQKTSLATQVFTIFKMAAVIFKMALILQFSPIIFIIYFTNLIKILFFSNIYLSMTPHSHNSYFVQN